MLTFDKVTKIYGNGDKALDDVSFEINHGEFVILEGRSGAGKTTIIKTTIKEVPVTSGKIMVDGDDIEKISKRNTPLLRRKVGVVFQDFKILSDRTVGENIEIALEILGLEPKVIEKRRDELLELTGIEKKRDNFPVQLSGGELQRVVIARALSGEPKILFADEPTGNLDKETALSIIDLLKDINNQGTTVVMATHDSHLLGDHKLRVIHLEEGRLAKDTGAKAKKKDQVEEKKEEEEQDKVSKGEPKKETKIQKDSP